jgi:ribosomal protein L37AE/L43A
MTSIFVAEGERLPYVCPSCGSTIPFHDWKIVPCRNCGREFHRTELLTTEWQRVGTVGNVA